MHAPCSCLVFTSFRLDVKVWEANRSWKVGWDGLGCRINAVWQQWYRDLIRLIRFTVLIWTSECLTATTQCSWSLWIMNRITFITGVSYASEAALIELFVIAGLTIDVSFWYSGFGQICLHEPLRGHTFVHPIVMGAWISPEQLFGYRRFRHLEKRENQNRVKLKTE